MILPLHRRFFAAIAGAVVAGVALSPRPAFAPVLKANTPVYQYAPGTWGPKEVERVSPPGGWNNPGEKQGSAAEGEAAK